MSSLSWSQNAQTISGISSRYDEVVAFLDFKFRDGFVHPVSTAEEYEVWRLIVGNARRVKLVKCGEYRKGESKGESEKGQNVLGTDRPPQMVGETHIYARDGKYQRLRMMQK